MAGSDPGLSRFSRRQILTALGAGAAAVGSVPLLSACSGGSSGLSGDTGGGGGAKPTINQWYHQYGEAGTQQAVMRYAKEYPDANVKVQWTPGDYTSKLNSGLLSSSGRTSSRAASTSTRCKSKQVVALDDMIADVKDDYTDADIKSDRSTARSTASRSSTTWACSTTARACWRRPACSRRPRWTS